jgi:hypothetical protein
MAKPMSRPTVLLPGQEKSITVTLRSVRNPPLDIKLTSQLPTTSVLEIKSAVAENTSIPTAKIKLLYNKKPVADTKVLKDLVADGGAPEVEFSVMVLGGAAAVAAATTTPATPSSDPGPKSEAALREDALPASGAAALETPEFWADLKSFLTLRLKDEDAAARAADVFQQAWTSKVQT